MMKSNKLIGMIQPKLSKNLMSAQIYTVLVSRKNNKFEKKNGCYLIDLKGHKFKSMRNQMIKISKM